MLRRDPEILPHHHPERVFVCMYKKTLPRVRVGCVSTQDFLRIAKHRQLERPEPGSQDILGRVL